MLNVHIKRLILVCFLFFSVQQCCASYDIWAAILYGYEEVQKGFGKKPDKIKALIIENEKKLKECAKQLGYAAIWGYLDLSNLKLSDTDLDVLISAAMLIEKSACNKIEKLNLEGNGLVWISNRFIKSFPHLCAVNISQNSFPAGNKKCVIDEFKKIPMMWHIVADGITWHRNRATKEWELSQASPN